jgi:uncharacterized protein YacL
MTAGRPGGTSREGEGMRTARRNGASALSVVTFRLVVGTLGAVAGAYLAYEFLRRGWLVGPFNVGYLAALGLLLGYLLSGRVAERFGRYVDDVVGRIGAIPPDVVVAAGSGAIVGLLVTVLANNVLALIPGFTWYWSLLIAVLLVGSFSSYFAVNRRFFASVPRAVAANGGRAPDEVGRDKVVDTSAIIDGRLVDVVEASFLDGRLLVPQFVLQELQRIADADEPLRRKRGRRGLEVLDRLVQQAHVRTEVVPDDVASASSVDDKLIRLCQERAAALVTTDFNLNRVAALQGVRVLNVNQLANALRAHYLPGDRISLTVVKPGREAGQGLAYLEDGTMVVIEDATDAIGRTVDVVVTSNLQTNMGRMIFARRADESESPASGGAARGDGS